MATVGAVATLDGLGAFVLQCGTGGHFDVWSISGGLHQLTHALRSGVSSLSATASGAVTYASVGKAGEQVHVLRSGVESDDDIASGNAPAVALDGRIAFVKVDQSRRPLRDDVFVFDGKHTHKVATFSLVWLLFWHHGRLAAMIGEHRTQFVWDIKHPKQRLALPAHDPRAVVVQPDLERVAAPMPGKAGRYGFGIASRKSHRFVRVAENLVPLAWSPSGHFMLAIDHPPSDRLSVVDLDRRVAARVGSLPCGRVEYAAWLPRNTKLPRASSG